MASKRKAAQALDADSRLATKMKTVSEPTDTPWKEFRTSNHLSTTTSVDVREKYLLQEIREQFCNTMQGDGPAFLTALVKEAETLKKVDLPDIAKQLESSQEWTTFTSSVGNSKSNVTELVGALSTLAQILEKRLGPSQHKFIRQGDNPISDAEPGSSSGLLKPDIVMIRNTTLTSTKNRDIFAIVESKNYSGTTQMNFRRLYANAILKATHVLNDGIERKYTFAIFVLKLELLVAVVDRSGALLFKLTSDFSANLSLFVNFFTVCLYNSPENLGLRPDILQLDNELIEMNVGGEMIQARVKRECSPSKDHLIGRATTIRCVSYEGDFPEKLVKSSWQLFGDVERPKEPAMLKLLAENNIKNIQRLFCYSTGEFNTQIGRREFKPANLVLTKNNPDSQPFAASSTIRYGNEGSDFSSLRTISEFNSLSKKSTDPPLDTEQRMTDFVQRSDSLSREYEVLVTWYCGQPVDAKTHMDGSPITHTQRYRAYAAGLNGYLGAYDIGLLHRDISPGNIAITPPVQRFYSRFGDGTLLDFDHARSVKRDDKAKPEQIGTGFYMATVVLMNPIIWHLAWYDFESFFWVIFLTEISLHQKESPYLGKCISRLESSTSYESIADRRLCSLWCTDGFRKATEPLPPAVRNLLVQFREFIFRPGEEDKDFTDLSNDYEKFDRFRCLKKENVRSQGEKLIKLFKACAES